MIAKFNKTKIWEDLWWDGCTKKKSNLIWRRPDSLSKNNLRIFRRDIPLKSDLQLEKHCEMQKNKKIIY